MHKRKTQHRNAVDADSEEVLYAVGSMQFMQSEQAHGCEHQDAVARAKVATIYRREELENYCAKPPQLCGILDYRSQAQTAIDSALHHEKECSEQNKKRDQTRERSRGRPNQKPRAEPTPDHAGNSQTLQNRRAVFEFFAVAEQSAKEARPERYSTCGIGDLWIQSEPYQHGKRQQCSTTRNRVDCPSCERSTEHDKPGEEMHRERRPKTIKTGVRTPCSNTGNTYS